MPRAQAYLGFMYQYGRGVPQNYALAAYWYRRSAEQGNAIAQHLLGLMFDKGLGVPDQPRRGACVAQPRGCAHQGRRARGQCAAARCGRVEDELRPARRRAVPGAAPGSRSPSAEHDPKVSPASQPARSSGKASSVERTSAGAGGRIRHARLECPLQLRFGRTGPPGAALGQAGPPVRPEPAAPAWWSACPSAASPRGLSPNAAPSRRWSCPVLSRTTLLVA